MWALWVASSIHCCKSQVKELIAEMMSMVGWFTRWRRRLRRQTAKPFGALVATATKHLDDTMVTSCPQYIGYLSKGPLTLSAVQSGAMHHLRWYTPYINTTRWKTHDPFLNFAPVIYLGLVKLRTSNFVCWLIHWSTGAHMMYYPKSDVLRVAWFLNFGK